MDQKTRAAIIYIAARLITGKQLNSVYDCSDSKYYTFSGTIKPNQEIDIFDNKGQYKITGQYNGAKYVLFHYGNDHPIDLIIDGDRFTGFDYGQKYHFSGNIENGRTIIINDYEFSKYFSYYI